MKAYIEILYFINTIQFHYYSIYSPQRRTADRSQEQPWHAGKSLEYVHHHKWNNLNARHTQLVVDEI